MADAGYRVVRYDRYGVGYSDRLKGIRYDADLFDRQLLVLIGKLKVKTPLTLVGFSLGGNIAVIFAERHPELVQSALWLRPHDPLPAHEDCETLPGSAGLTATVNIC